MKEWSFVFIRYNLIFSDSKVPSDTESGNQISSPPSMPLSGYTLCWDNIQIDSEARHQGLTQNSKIHLLALCYAAENRVPTVDLEVHRNNTVPALSLPLDTYLPQPEDYNALRDRMVVLVERLIVEEFAFFHAYRDVVLKHIPHKYSTEMSRQSSVVS